MRGAGKVARLRGWGVCVGVMLTMWGGQASVNAGSPPNDSSSTSPGVRVTINMTGLAPDLLSERLSVTDRYYGMDGGHFGDSSRLRHIGFSVFHYGISFSSGLGVGDAACRYGFAVQMPPGPTSHFPDGKDSRGPVDLTLMAELLDGMSGFSPGFEDGWVSPEYKGIGIGFPETAVNTKIWVYPVPDESATYQEWARLREEGLKVWERLEWGDSGLVRNDFGTRLPWLQSLPLALPKPLDLGDLMDHNGPGSERIALCQARLREVLDGQAVLWPFLHGDYLPVEPESDEPTT